MLLFRCMFIFFEGEEFMKKTISIVLSFCVLFSLIEGINYSVYALESSGNCGENLTYTFEESTGEVVISGTGKMTDYNTFSENKSPFSNQAAIKSVIINDGVQSIGSDAFYKCENLISIQISNSVVSIGSDAFGSCKKLEKLEIPDSVKIIYDYAFEDCESISELSFGKELKKIDNGAFENCKSISSINLPSGLTIIGDYCFEGCKNLEYISIPNSVTNIGFLALEDCTSLISITMDENSYYYSVDGVLFRKKDDCLLWYPSSKTEPNYVVPNGIKEIYKIENCFYLKTITLPISLESLYISNCKNITDIFYVGSETAFNCIERNDDFYDIYLLANIHYYCYCQSGHRIVTNKSVKATCTTDGKVGSSYCLLCGEVLVEQKTVKAKGHKEQTVKGTPATFKAAGKTDGKKCSVCGKILVAQKTIAKLGAPSLSSVSAASKGFKASWKSVKNIDGYQIQYSTSSSFKNAKKVTVSGYKSKSKTVKNLKANKKYYVRIRAYKKINGNNKYSDWSAKKPVTTKK